MYHLELTPKSYGLSLNWKLEVRAGKIKVSNLVVK
jgi:hypothetical protein